MVVEEGEGIGGCGGIGDGVGFARFGGQSLPGGQRLMAVSSLFWPRQTMLREPGKSPNPGTGAKVSVRVKSPAAITQRLPGVMTGAVLAEPA